MPGLGLGITPFVRHGVIGGGIPFKSDALFWLDGTILADEFVDKSGNGKNFTITNNDIELLKGFPYKSRATISAPTGDAVLFAADINSFLYGVDADSPNAIPVCSFFQNIDYEDKIFTRHLSQLLDPDGNELVEPFIVDIVLYSSVLTGADLTNANSYYGVPVEVTSNVKWVAKDGNDTTGNGTKALPYLTIFKGYAETPVGGQLYVKTGDYSSATGGFAYWRVDKACTNSSLGNVKLNSSSDTNYVINGVGGGVGSQFDGFYINATTEKWACNLGAAIIVNRCKLSSGVTATARATATVTQAEYRNCVIGTAKVTDFSSAVKYNTCHITQDSGSANLFFTSSANPLTVLNSKVNVINAGSFVRPGHAADIIIKGNNISITNNIIGLYSQAAAPTSFDFSGNTITSAVDFTATSGVLEINTTVFTANNNTITLTNTGIDTPLFYGVDLTSIEMTNNLIKTSSTVDMPHVTLRTLSAVTTASAVIENNKSIAQGGSNYIYRLGDEATGSYDDRIEGISIKNNYIRNDGNAVNTTHGIFVGHNINADIRYNRVEGYKYHTVYKHSGGVVTNGSVSYNVSVGGHILIFGLEDAKRYNNTVYMNAAFDNTALSFSDNGGGDPDGCDGKNNLIEATVDNTYTLNSIQDVTGLESDYNLFYQVGGSALFRLDAVAKTFAEMQSAGFETNSLNDQDPLLDANYIPQSGSPAIEGGIALDAAYDDGLDSSTNWGGDSSLPSVVTKQQTGSWDIGAYVS